MCLSLQLDCEFLEKLSYVYFCLQCLALKEWMKTTSCEVCVVCGVGVCVWQIEKVPQPLKSRADGLYSGWVMWWDGGRGGGAVLCFTEHSSSELENSAANLWDFWAWNLKQHSCFVRSLGSKMFWISNCVLWVVLCICEPRIIALPIGTEMTCSYESTAPSLLARAAFTYGHSLGFLLF